MKQYDRVDVDVDMDLMGFGGQDDDNTTCNRAYCHGIINESFT
jgi:hypothetical protein